MQNLDLYFTPIQFLICCMGTFDRSLMTSVVSREVLICTKMRLKV